MFRMFRSEKVWHEMGCILSVLVIIVGIVFAFTPPESYHTKSVSDHIFGADFYTYEYEATQIAGTNVAVVANNLREIGVAQAHYVGAAFVMTGLFALLYFTRKLFMIPAKDNISEKQGVSEERSDQSPIE